MKRLHDLLLVSVASLLLALPLLAIALWVRLTSPGPALYWSQRVGRDNRLFAMPKFRSMRIDTPEVATHLLERPEQWLTPIGGFLRSSSLDELPQLWNILLIRHGLLQSPDAVQLEPVEGLRHLSPSKVYE